MKLMNKLAQRMNGMMQGRYGTDRYGLFLIGASLVVDIVGTIVQLPYLLLATDAILVYELFRFFSKNVVKRSIENQKYTKAQRVVVRGAKVLWKNVTDRKYKYFLCPECAQIVRVPRGHGSVSIRCPQCHHEFSGRS